MPDETTNGATPDSANDSSSTTTTTTTSEPSFVATIASTFRSAASTDDNGINDHGNDHSTNTDRAVKLGLFWDEWSRCIGSGYQGDSLYRHGKLDGCGKQWRDLKLAAEARLIQWRNPQAAKELIESTYFHKRTTISPTAGAIWELKERPGWD